MTITDNSRADALTDDAILRLAARCDVDQHLTQGQAISFARAVLASVPGERPVEQHEAAPADAHYEALEREHLGDPEKKTGIYAENPTGIGYDTSDEELERILAKPPSSAPLEGTGNGADERADAIIEKIAAQWDGSVFAGHNVDIGMAIRDAWKRRVHAAPSQPAAEQKAMAIYQVRTKGSLKWQDLEPISFGMYADEEQYVRRIVYTAPRTEVAGAVPEGWKLVPVEPTQAMLDRGYWPCTQGRGAKSVWGEMLRAVPAPQPPSANAATAPADERVAFETFWKSEMNTQEMDLYRCSFPMMQHDEQPYACHETQRAWLTWQARAAASQPHQPSGEDRDV